MEVVDGLFILVMIIGLYFLPTIIAFNRNHEQRNVILIINLFLGWTVLAWVIALAWSVSHQKEKV